MAADVVRKDFEEFMRGDSESAGRETGGRW